MPCPVILTARANLSRRPAAAATRAVLLVIGALVTEWILFGSDSSSLRAQRASVTFTKDVAPILFKACVSCHRPEGVAPFSLLTYEDAKSHAAAIVAATRDRVMPPWKPEPGY